MNIRVPLLCLALAPVGASAGEPISVPAPDIKPGDTWVFDRSEERGTSGYTDQRLAFKVQSVGRDSMVLGVKVDGSPVDFEDHVMGVDWSQRRLISGEQTTTGRPFSFPLSIGKTWTSDFTDPTRRGLQISAEHHETNTVDGWEDVTTPAGVFHAIKISSDDKVKAQFMSAGGAAGGPVGSAAGSTAVTQTTRTGIHTEYAELYSTFYYVPEVKYYVKMVQDNYNSENIRTKRQVDLLTSFKSAP